ncbi:MAG: redoxin domain-containing protein [Planctomycetes bacterium]|nr:redoxin domain-containing protein [Planctomycetota bacterium]
MLSRLILASVLVMSKPAAAAESPHLIPLLDLSGCIHALEQNDARHVRAFIFLGSECPISQTLVPTLNRLVAAYQAQGVELFGVWSDPSVTRAEAAAHFTEWQVAFPVLHDSARMLREELKPTHVPEAFVLSEDGRLIYRGAIDNSYQEPGHRRTNVEKHFLADALRAALDGTPPLVAQTPAVGCAFMAEPRIASPATVTFTRDIAPIVFARCTTCHRDGQAAPFPLTNFAQVAKRAKQLADVTAERVMPPWMPSRDHQRFVGERSLAPMEIALFRQWAAVGAPEGLAADLPPLPQFPQGWRLGKPDLVVKMNEAFTVHADGADILQNFVLPLPISADRMVAGIEFHPGNARVVHHAVLFLDDKGSARKLDAATPEPGYEKFGGPGFLPSGALGGWSVGNTARRLPGGMGRYVKRGSDLVVQIHYHPTGKPEMDQSEIGIYFVDKPVAELLKEASTLVGSIWMANYDMDISAGDADYRRQTSYVLPRDIIMVGVVPHMHLLGKSMTVTATRPDGTRQTLIDVPHWNYNWQDEYYFERPFRLPQGTRLDVTAVFDNSAGNPSNPSSPPRRVTWGDGSLNEMMFCFFLISAEKTEDLIHTVYHNLDHDAQQPRTEVVPNPSSMP